MANRYDRAAEDLGNIVALEHVNVQIPDQRLATLFYVTGLGLTRDPYLMTGVGNMWINIGRSQFHLPTGEAQVLRGHVGLVLPDIDALPRRLEAVRGALDGTAFGFAAEGHNDAVDVTSPWGNRIRCHRPNGRFGRMALGMPYVELDVPEGAAPGIARFYRDILGAPATLGEAGGAPAAHVPVGYAQQLVYRENGEALPAYDGHHLAVYLADFSGPHARLEERGLITEESDQHQYRFQAIVDPEDGTPLFEIEHEIRSMTHPLFARPLVNRNPDQTNTAFAPDHEHRPWAMPCSP